MKVIEVKGFSVEILSSRQIIVRFAVCTDGRIRETARWKPGFDRLQSYEQLWIPVDEYKHMFKTAYAILKKRKDRWLDPNQLRLGL